MIVVGPEAPQAIHAACVSLPNPCDVKQLGRGPKSLQRNVAPRVGSGGLYGPPFSPSTPFFALSAEDHSCLRNLQFSQRRARLVCRLERPDPGGRLQERGGIYEPVSSPSTPFSALSAVAGIKPKNRRIEAQSRLSGSVKLPLIWQAVSRRRAACIDHSRSRQQPFCTLLHFAAVACQNRRI